MFSFKLSRNAVIECILGIFIFWALFPWGFSHFAGYKLSELAQFGDVYSIANSFFTVLAFIAAAFAVYSQNQQLELAKSVHANERHLAQLTARLGALPLLIEQCNQRLKHAPDPEIPPNVFSATTEKAIQEIERVIKIDEDNQLVLKARAERVQSRIGDADHLMGRSSTHTDLIRAAETREALEKEINAYPQATISIMTRRHYVVLLKERLAYETALERIYQELSQPSPSECAL
jgi:hypothetical protein